MILKQFTTHEGCIEYIKKKRKQTCTSCHQSNFWTTGKGLFQCKNCNKQISPTRGTIFYKSHVPLEKWFLIIWYMTEKFDFVATTQIQEKIQISRQTSLKIIKKIQKEMRPRYIHASLNHNIVLGHFPIYSIHNPFQKNCRLAYIFEVQKKKIKKIRFRQIIRETPNFWKNFVEDNLSLTNVVVQCPNDFTMRSSISLSNSRVSFKTEKEMEDENKKIEYIPNAETLQNDVDKWLCNYPEKFQGKIPNEIINELIFRLENKNAKKGDLFFKLLNRCIQ